MTIKELSVLHKNGEESTLIFENGVLKKKVDEGEQSVYKTTNYLKRKDRKAKVVISQALANQDLENAVAISGTFLVNGEEVVQEGLLGNIFFSSK